MTRVPRPAHVVVVVMENHAYTQIIGSAAAPFLNSLAGSGVSFTQSYAITHPSEPNYLALFSGSTHSLSSDSCPHAFTGANLATSLRMAGDTFVGYSESLPATGFTGCSSGDYARKHAPWVNYAALPNSVNRPFTAFPRNYSALPTVSFVIPNLEHDMHNGTVAQGDRWLKQELGSYARWAAGHNSLLIITWDEDNDHEHNRIPTIIAGAHIKPGRYAEHVTHYRLLRTLEYWYGLAPIAASAATGPITDIWQS